ncbi:MAG TPA: S8 family serine peptidase [Thermoanaerobaculia bacterium]|nr:S8 family serine peptidase [Thermoanaerobaculia bacterium]
MAAFTSRFHRGFLGLVAVLTLAATPAFAKAELGPTLVQQLASAAADQRIEVIVTFHGDGPATAAQLDRLRAIGVGGVYFQRLPMAGVVATPAQLQAIAAMADVRSVWFNDRLQYEMAQARTLTSVDQLAANDQLRTADGLPFTGRGIGILVNDSGVDGTHPDLLFGTKVVQNVLGHAGGPLNAGTLEPLLNIENVPNTDVAGSHGTHVAGIAAGLGTMSNGVHAGAAKGAHIVGYGSGAAISVLNTAGAFDYALANRERYNIRVITNSFGGTSTIGQPFNANDPIVIASKKLADAGVITVFSAGNSGSGPDTITGPYKKSPWVVLAGNGTKNGTLASSSSRGRIAGGVYNVTIDNETFTVEDRPTVVAPGTEIAAPRALVTADATGNIGFEHDLAVLGPTLAPFYSIKTGTSMAAPHVAGLVAILLEANPNLTWREVKSILQSTATNMSGYEPWEAGAGHANIEAAVAMALGKRSDFRLANNLTRPNGFNANATITESPVVNTYNIAFMPAPRGQTGSAQFDVAADVAVVTARWAQPTGSPCTCAILLIDPDGKSYGSGVATPVLAPIVSAAAPGKPGRWTVTLRGIGSVSGVSVDPLKLTNGVAGPGTAAVTVRTYITQGFTGLSDIATHPMRGVIEFAASNRLADSLVNGEFKPDRKIDRIAAAEYLVSGFGIRQRLDLSGRALFSDLLTQNRAAEVFAQMVTARGALLFDHDHNAKAVSLVDRSRGMFKPSADMERQELAYALIQSLGLESTAAAITGDVTAPYEGARIVLSDQDRIRPELRGYVQLALDLGILTADFVVDNTNPLLPRIKAVFKPLEGITRGDYALAAVQANLHHLK